MIRGGRRSELFAVLATASFLILSSFTLEPMSTSLAPTGAGAIGTFRLKNDSSERIAIRLSILKRSMEPDGKEINEAADGLFTIYPSRLVLEPASTSAVKVQWKGDVSPSSELCFRLVAEQVAVNFSAVQSSGIKIMFRYIASLYVTPSGSSHRLVVESARGAVDGEGKNGILLVVRNTGNRHVIAVDSSFELKDKEGGPETILLSGETLGGVDGANYLPGLPRRFFVPYPDAIPGRVYEALFRFTPES